MRPPAHVLYDTSGVEKLPPDALRDGRPLWYGDLSQGSFGSEAYTTGDEIPPPNEVVFARGDSGIHRLIRMGFAPANGIKRSLPHEYWETFASTIEGRFHVNLETYLNGFPSDPSRLSWGCILPHTLAGPPRLYLPRTSNANNVTHMIGVFKNIGVPLPELFLFTEEGELVPVTMSSDN